VDNATPDRRAAPIVTSSAYTLLFVLGALEALLGAFHYGQAIGPVPAGALVADVVILVTTVAAAWGMQAPTGGLMPAVGWFVAAFVLAMATPGGSVVITNSSAGKWFLYGGAICATAAVVTSFAWSSRAARQPGPGR
jgi:predicted outer membrane repeat protein